MFGEISEYVFYALTNFRVSFDTIVIIVESECNGKISDFENYGDFIIQVNKHSNIIGDTDIPDVLSSISRADIVCFIDDSFFGPIYDFSELLNGFAGSSSDFMNFGFYPSEKYKKDILFIKSSALNLIDFNNFFNEDYIDILSSKLLKNGLKQHFYCGQDDVSDKCLEVLFEKKFPLIRIHDLVYNSFDPRYIIDLIRQNSEYPVALIEQYVFAKYNPNLSSKLFSKTIFPIESSSITAVP
jgi:lipopolysaccharide biosynthesis protein